jgi:predicted MFS family arabinose efflux permease
VSIPGSQTVVGAKQAEDRIPVWRLLALTTAGFLAIMTETMPAGLLPQIGEGLSVSEGLAGQLVTLYAVGSVIAAVPVIAATRSMRRRPLLLLAVVGLLVFNTVTAVSSSYGLTLVARFGAGMASGVVWGLLAGYGRRIVAEHLQGRALAVVGVGQPIALTFGVPLGTWLGSLFDWRGVFWIISAVALVLTVWIRVLVPDFPGQSAGDRLPLQKIFVTPGVRSVLCVMFLWILAHNILYTYVAPFLSTAGLGSRVDIALLVFGLAAIVGIWLTGILIDRLLRIITLASLAGFSMGALALGIANHAVVVIFVGIVAWGFTFGGAPTLLQTALADSAGEGADVAQSMFVTVFNSAVAAGGVIGGLLLDSTGAESIPWSLLVLTIPALVLVTVKRKHGFTPGSRS